MRTRLGLVAMALILTACGGTPAAPSDSASATESTTAATAADFGKAIDLGGGVSVTVSVPGTFTPGSFASNYLPGQVSDLFTIDVTNKGTAPLDLSSISFAPTSGTAFCSDVLDGDNGINGAPTDPVAAGGTASFKYAIACDAKVGDPLALGITYSDTNLTLAGKLV
jgi:hypothetical protein